MTGEGLKAGPPRRGSRRKTDPPAFPTLVPFGARLESLRLQRGYTQRALAKRAGISTNHCQDIAHAQANPTATVLLGLSDALCVSIADLFGARTPAPDEQRLVFAVEINDLAATHKLFTDIAKRLTKAKRATTSASHRRAREPGSRSASAEM